MTTTLQEKTTTVEDVLVRHFALGADGFWYPLASGIPVVRVKIENGMYRVERRRSATTSWLPLAEGLASDFDAESFDTWASNWTLTVQW